MGTQTWILVWPWHVMTWVINWWNTTQPSHLSILNHMCNLFILYQDTSTDFPNPTCLFLFLLCWLISLAACLVSSQISLPFSLLGQARIYKVLIVKIMYWSLIAPFIWVHIDKKSGFWTLLFFVSDIRTKAIWNGGLRLLAGFHLLYSNLADTLLEIYRKTKLLFDTDFSVHSKFLLSVRTTHEIIKRWKCPETYLEQLESLGKGPEYVVGVAIVMVLLCNSREDPLRL